MTPASTVARPASRQRWLGVATGVAIVITVIIAYAPALRAPFVLDDFGSVTSNPSIRSLWPLSAALHPPPSTVTGRPVVNYTLAISTALTKALAADTTHIGSGDRDEPTIGHHLFNLLVHLACGGLLFGVVRRTLRSQRFDASLRGRSAPFAAALTALWLLHPIQTEAVDYVVQRTETVVALFLLGTLYAWVRAWESPGRRERAAWRVAAVSMCLIGMGAKEVMVVAPVLILLYDRAFRLGSWSELFRESNVDRPGDGRIWFYGALFCTIGWLIAILVGNPRGGTVGFDRVKWYDYLYDQGWAIGHYLRLTLWPTGLSVDYGERLPAGVARAPGFAFLIACGVLTLVAWTRAARWGWFGFLGAWFFLILAASSSIVPVATEVAAERRLYLPLAAVLLLLLLAGDALLRRPFRSAPSRHPLARFLAPALVIGIAVVSAAFTFQRSRLYQDSEALYRDAIAKVPSNSRIYGYLAGFLEQQPARVADALVLYRQAVAIDSNDVHAWDGLAQLLIDQHQYAEGKQVVERLLEKNPNVPHLYDLLGVAIGALESPGGGDPLS